VATSTNFFDQTTAPRIQALQLNKSTLLSESSEFQLEK